MRLPLAALLYLLTLPALALADLPVAKIRLSTDGATFTPGDIVLCEPDTLDPECKVRWFVRPERHPDGRPTSMPIDAGRRIVLSTRPGTYYVRLVVSNADGPDFAELDVIVGPLPTPGPDPKPIPPGPPPKPNFPDSTLGLSQFVYDSAKAVNQPNVAKKLADSYRGVASQIAAGVLTEKTQVTAATLAANRIAVGDQADAWSDFFRSTLPKQLGALENAGKLSTMPAIQAAWIEIAVGLEAAR